MTHKIKKNPLYCWKMVDIAMGSFVGGRAPVSTFLWWDFSLPYFGGSVRTSGWWSWEEVVRKKSGRQSKSLEKKYLSKIFYLFIISLDFTLQSNKVTRKYITITAMITAAGFLKGGKGSIQKLQQQKKYIEKSSLLHELANTLGSKVWLVVAGLRAHVGFNLFDSSRQMAEILVTLGPNYNTIFDTDLKNAEIIVKVQKVGHANRKRAS